MSASRALRLKIGWVYPSGSADEAILNDRASFCRAYAEYLYLAHAIVRASVPLMELARERATLRHRDETVALPFAAYLEHHIVEERNHDEWVLEDLAVLGVDRTTVLNRIPPPSVATLVGSQYYWIAHHDPIAVLGYIAVLEGMPFDPARIESVARRLDLPPSAFRSLQRHAQLDPAHRDDLDRLIDQLPLSPADTALLGVSALHTARWLNEVIHPGVRVIA